MNTEININNQNIENFLTDIKTTQEYFNKTIDELLVANKYNYTREENLLYDSGDRISFFDSLEELKNEKTEYESYIKNYRLEIKDIVKTINERIAVILI